MRTRNVYRPAAMLFLAAGIVLLSGCQETPEESAVVSRAEGLSEDAAAEPLKEGETQTIELPAKWEETKKWNDDRWIFQADMALEPIETGNLPVVEMEPYAMSQEELEKLTAYFADGRELYVPKPDSREDYQKKLDRIQNMEGVYSVYTIDVLLSDETRMLREGLELATPEAELTDQKTEVRFGPREMDPAEAATYKDYYSDEIETYDRDLYFSADVGENRESHITARKYDPDTGKTSSFEWIAGDELLLQKNDIDRYKSIHSQYADASETDKKWEELLDRCTAMMTEENIDEKTGQVKAEALLAELGIDGKIYACSEPALWFPSGTYEEDIAYSYFDSLWNADLSQAEPGYVYTFLNEVGGLPVDVQYGGGTWGTGEGESEAYAPAISVETVSVAVTRSGIKMFSWTGMAKEVSVVAENVKIQDFEKIQERIRQYISYCFPGNQPVDSTAVFYYELEEMSFGYTYIPAYENPDHVWAVPAWFLEFRNYYKEPELDGGKEEKAASWLSLTFNAMDGGVVKAG